MRVVRERASTKVVVIGGVSCAGDSSEFDTRVMSGSATDRF